MKDDADEDAGGPRRVRRPKDKEELIERLRAKNGGAFAEIRDVLLFAAAVGFEKDRYDPFTEGSGEPIRWETFVNRWFAEELTTMLAVAHSDDKDIASPARIEDQIAIFEAFANGGLGFLETHLARLDDQDPLDAIVELIQATKRPPRGVDALIDLAVDPDL